MGRGGELQTWERPAPPRSTTDSTPVAGFEVEIMGSVSPPPAL
jgi:hypothetical protein